MIILQTIIGKEAGRFHLTIKLKSSGIATARYLPGHRFTLPRRQKMWFTMALAKVLHFMTLNAPSTNDTPDIAVPYAFKL